jgi:hypothetical protein
MAAASYALCIVTATACAWLLSRGYRESGSRLLFWSALCFWGLSVSNGLLFLDLVIVPDRDLYWARLMTGFLSTCLLLFGMIWDRD